MNEATWKAVLILWLGAVGEAILGRVITGGFLEDMTSKVRTER